MPRTWPRFGSRCRGVAASPGAARKGTAYTCGCAPFALSAARRAFAARLLASRRPLFRRRSQPDFRRAVDDVGSDHVFSFHLRRTKVCPPRPDRSQVVTEDRGSSAAGADYSRSRTPYPLQMKPRERWNRLVSRVREMVPFFNSAARGQRFQPERRSGFRIFTLKNARWLALSLTVLFLVYSAYMERRSQSATNYGRLYDRRIDLARPTAPPVQREIVTEAPEPRPAQVVRRDVLLNRQEDASPELTSSAQTATTVAPVVRQPVRLRRDGDRVVISGGTEGVRIDVQPAPPTATAPPPRGEVRRFIRPANPRRQPVTLLNLIRVGVIYSAVEPEPGVYDDVYLESIKGTVAGSSPARPPSLPASSSPRALYAARRCANRPSILLSVSAL
jgi:hypothetical protein